MSKQSYLVNDQGSHIEGGITYLLLLNQVYVNCGCKRLFGVCVFLSQLSSTKDLFLKPPYKFSTLQVSGYKFDSSLLGSSVQHIFTLNLL